MKLTKGKLSKLLKKNKQSHKKRNNKKKNHKRNTFRNNKKVNLANKTLKNLKTGGTNQGEPGEIELTSLAPDPLPQEVGNIVDTNSSTLLAPPIEKDTSTAENSGIELTSLSPPPEENDSLVPPPEEVSNTNFDTLVASPSHGCSPPRKRYSVKSLQLLLVYAALIYY
jgi:hypothetical protein